jgi:23S rRNA G2445 N2-methylase RlmL
MSKYEPLWNHLKADGRDTLRMTFEEIHAVLGVDIDHSFLTYKKEAAQYGYKVGKISLKEKHVTFNKEGK